MWRGGKIWSEILKASLKYKLAKGLGVLAIAHKASNLDRKISDLKRRGEIFTQNKSKSGNHSHEDDFARLILEFAERVHSWDFALTALVPRSRR